VNLSIDLYTHESINVYIHTHTHTHCRACTGMKWRKSVSNVPEGLCVLVGGSYWPGECMCICVCVCERERERMCFFFDPLECGGLLFAEGTLLYSSDIRRCVCVSVACHSFIHSFGSHTLTPRLLHCITITTHTGLDFGPALLTRPPWSAQ
jgi:hypothetical protein